MHLKWQLRYYYCIYCDDTILHYTGLLQDVFNQRMVSELHRKKQIDVLRSVATNKMYYFGRANR